MENKKIKEILANIDWNSFPRSAWDSDYSDIIDALNNLNNIIQETNDIMWQDTDKIKPEYCKEVLVLDEDEYFYLGYWSDNQKWYNTTQGQYFKQKINFWMSLPEMPK